MSAFFRWTTRDGVSRRNIPRVNQSVVFLLLLLAATASAQYDPECPEPIGKIPGALVLHGGGEISDEVRQTFWELAGGNAAKIVVISSADPDNPLKPSRVELWKELEPTSVELLHAETREQAATPEFSAVLETATGVWFSGGWQTRLASLYLGTPVEERVHGVMRRGGVVGGTSAGAAIASKVMLVREDIRTGMDLLPGAIVDQHFLAKNRKDRLIRAVTANPDRVGFGIDEDTALVVRGRALRVVGDSDVTVCLAASTSRPMRIESWKAGHKGDLIALSRAAQARSRRPFPSAMPLRPHVDTGTLIIVGGGATPKGLTKRFVELAGGANAKIVVIPCSEADEIRRDPMVDALQKLGAGTVTLLHTKNRKLASSPDFVQPLADATGVWLGGGRQWNFVDSYQNTMAHKLMHDVLSRGGVIAGSSAGASIQGDYMPRGDPLGNLVMMAEGYESGLGFLTGVAIDQHFSQRKRFADMSALMKTHPQLLGIGLDEGTAIVVQKSIAEVVGTGRVAFYNYSQSPPPTDDAPDYLSVEEGKAYDLEARRIVE